MKTPPRLPRPALRLAALVCLAALAPLASAQSTYNPPYHLTTLAGRFLSIGNDDGPIGQSRVNSARGIAVDAAGNVYVADTNNHTIRKISFYGVTSTIAGTAGAGGYVDAAGTAARFLQPRGLALDAAGNLYVADSGNHAIRRITPAGVVTTLAGNGSVGNVNGTGAAARFRLPVYLAIDSAGTIYVSDNNNNVIRKVTPAGVVTTLSNSGGTPITITNSLGVAVDGAGNVYASEQFGRGIVKITPGGVLSVLAGGVEGSTDGVGAAARFRYPAGLAVDNAGNVFVCDPGNVVVRRITPDGTVTTIAGRVPFTGGIDGFGDAARFADPVGVAVDARGNVYVADVQLIRATVFAPDIVPQPVGKVVVPGENYTLTSGGRSNVPTTFQWRKDGVAIPGATTATLSLSVNNLPTWSSSLPLTNIQQASLGSYTLAATNLAGTTISSAAVIAFESPPTFAQHPASQTITPGANATFTAIATSPLAITYQWRKDGVAIPGATASALMLTNVQATDLGTYTVVATNAVGPTTSNAAVLGFPPSVAGRLINLSVLTGLGSPTDEFTLGYVVGGAGTAGTKPLVIRAAGPSLGALGVPGTVSDPTMELFAGATRTGGNDNWGGGADLVAAMAAVGAFPYSGATSRDAAVAASITTRDNSVRVTGVAGATGAVIAEIYDATPAASFHVATPRLLNVSVNKHLGASLTAGFVIGGATPARVLIRVIGPGLAQFGVPGTVVDPQLTLFRGQTEISANDNWVAADAAAFNSVGAFPLPAGSRDAALVITLTPDNYSVRATGSGNTTGIALVEVYELPSP